jgi:enamine deaminase RidA (YjgF/YER057c/UK114 family)
MNAKNFFELKEFKLPWYTKYYITVDLNNVKTMKEGLEQYEEIFKFIDQHQIKPVYEKIFGKLSSCEAITGARERYLKNLKIESSPLSYVEGDPTSGVPVSSIEIYGISTADKQVKINYYQDSENGQTMGTVVQTPTSKSLYLFGLKVANHGTMSTYQEFKTLYQTLQRYLKENNFTPEDIVRTWIYLSDISKNYGDFNTARREYFEENKVEYAASSQELPASTCIGGRASRESEMLINAICIDKKIQHPIIKRIYNKFQNEAEGSSYLFRPTFSRALLIEDEGLMELQVSGTASINETGETVYLDDPYQQIKKTLLNVGALLEQVDMDFSDFCESTCFFKQAEYYRDFLEVAKELKIGAFSNSFVVGDVCRDNLLFELDGIAVKAKRDSK